MKAPESLLTATRAAPKPPPLRAPAPPIPPLAITRGTRRNPARLQRRRWRDLLSPPSSASSPVLVTVEIPIRRLASGRCSPTCPRMVLPRGRLRAALDLAPTRGRNESGKAALDPGPVRPDPVSPGSRRDARRGLGKYLLVGREASAVRRTAGIEALAARAA
jgi:hypothetical protein